jgi:hypothetical protein
MTKPKEKTKPKKAPKKRDAAEYRKKSIKEKEAANRQHGIPNRCPECDVAVSPEDSIRHRKELCPGRPDPHPNARWVYHRQALAMGISAKELSELSAARIVRTMGEKGHRRYLMRDIAKHMQFKDVRAKVAKAKAQARAEVKSLDKTEGIAPQSQEMELTKRLRNYIEAVGSAAAASRNLNCPVDSIRKVAKGGKCSTTIEGYIEGALDKVGA